MHDHINISVEQFELILDDVVARLDEDFCDSDEYHTPDAFEKRVEDVLRNESSDSGITVESTFHASAFPDINAGGFGVEVKYTSRDRWYAIGNSIFEGSRDPDVDSIYIIFGKAGGKPEVRWRRYQDCITEVRLSHAPSFVVDMNASSLLFDNIGINYDEFSELNKEEKLVKIKEYYQGRLLPEERLWWMEEPRTLPMQVRLYAKLSQEEKNIVRSEAAILCPEICGSSQTKFIDAALFLLKHHGVFCPNVRDLFTSGFAAAEGDRISGLQTGEKEKHIVHTLRGLQNFMLDSIQTLDEELFCEYWGESYPVGERLNEWLRRADRYAQEWIPSQSLFMDSSGAGQLDTASKLTLF